MGGIRNREAKMKANHVVSSGAGGSSKGPSVIDKRNQELKCPYCDKVYTQSAAGRLKDHIAKQHAEEQGAPPGSNAPAAALPTAIATPASKAAKPAAAKDAPQASSSMRPASALAASGTSAAPVGNSAGAAGGGGGMMDLGSRAGYYTSKSPEMHLAEHLLRSKKVKARFVTKQLPSGLWTCKVVLPDGKNQERDVVVFLDEAHAAADDREARQRAAVAALQRVQGDRQLHLTLPSAYVPLWHTLGEEARHREAADAARAAAAARAREREAAAVKRQFERKPQSVVMSDSMQRLVQALLADAAGAGASGKSGPRHFNGSGIAVGSNAGMSTQTGAIVSGSGGDAALQQAEEQLGAMGFSPQQVQLAWERRSQPNPDFNALLDWLLISLPADQLPARFVSGSKTNAVTLVQRGGVSLASVARLMSHGYSSAEAEEALVASAGNEQAALLALYAELTGVDVLAQGQQAGVQNDEDAAAAAWGEEMEVLEAIYADAMQVTGERSVQVSVDLPEACPMATAQNFKLVLHVCCDHSASSSSSQNMPLSRYYPSTPPLLALSCSGLTGSALKALTCILATCSMRLASDAAPMVHELLSALLEAAEQLTPAMCVAAAGPRGGGGGHGNGDGLERGASSLVDGFEGMTMEEEEETEDEEAEGQAAARQGPRPPHTNTLRRSRPSIDLPAESSRLLDKQRALASDGGHAAMRRVRESLPAAKQREVLMQLLGSNDVVVISGATGCGKSTQVPQYLLEDAIARGRGAWCNILVTQPRRISALGLAGRVAQERGEKVGDVVGYSVRMEHKASGLTRLMYCTTGILLRRLLSDPHLAEMTHVVLDEVHERSIEVDLLLLLLKDVLARRSRAAAEAAASGKPAPLALKLILMSATADAQLFADYMSTSSSAPCPSSSSMSSNPAAAPLPAILAGPGKGANKSSAKAGRAAAGQGGNVGSDRPVGQLMIPGFTYPVREFYLEDILELTGTVVGRSSRYARKGGIKPYKDAPSSSQQAQQSQTDNADSTDMDTSMAGPAAVAGGGGAAGGAGVSARPARVLSQALPRYSEETLRSLDIVDEDQINYDLLADLIAVVIEQHERHGADAFLHDWSEAFKHGRGDSSGGGAVLVFLPGAPEIGRAQRSILASERCAQAAGGRGALRVVPLHGSLSSADQAKVFSRPPKGTYKVVLATNVAETSITIDDVTVVIDSGRAKEMRHDPDRGIMRLAEDWISQAAAQQRRGRAGRVRPGICFRVFSSAQWRRMPPHTQPEMLRAPLESVCLLLKGMAQHPALQGLGPTPNINTSATTTAIATNATTTTSCAIDASTTSPISSSGVAGVLSLCLSPPPPKAIQSALSLLRAIGAFDGEESLTPLGQHLNRMPMDPRVGKALVYGALLGCLDPVLTITAALAHGRPIILNAQGNDEVLAARRELLAPALSARSDHVALVLAYGRWAEAHARGGRSAAAALAAGAGLSDSGLEAVAAGRGEYARVLSDLGFLDWQDCRSAGRPEAVLPGSEWLSQPANRHAANWRFLKAAVCAGFYPSVLRVQHPPPKFVEVNGGNFESESEPHKIKFFDRERGRTFIHPGSICFGVGKYESGWMVYTEMTETSKLFVREASMVPVYALLLFGGELRSEPERQRLLVDEWVEFVANERVGAMVRAVRGRLDALLAAKIADPLMDVSDAQAVAVAQALIAGDGY